VIPSPQTILALGPHPDDIELGCGGSLARFEEGGSNIHIRVFSECSKSIPAGFVTADLVRECQEAATVLGASSCEVLKLPVRELPTHRQAVLEEMVKLNRLLQPDLVLVPSSGDFHQDHQVVYAEAVRAFRTCTVLGYEVAWSNRGHQPTLFIKLTDEQVNKKVEALRCYRTQVVAGRAYFKNDEMFRAPLRVRGSQVRELYAEGFEVILSVW